MGRSSTSSASSKAKVKKGKSKEGKLYCSKVVGTVLDKLIKQELEKVKKHPNTVAKWLGKMRSSILKKISISTPLLFKTERHDTAVIDAQMTYNLENIEKTREKIVAASRKMWQEKFDDMQQQAKHSSTKKQRGGGGKKNIVEDHIYSERVTAFNTNIDEMASQLSSIGEDLKRRVMSLNSSIQAAERLWVSHPLREQGLNTNVELRPDESKQDDISAEALSAVQKVSSKNRVYRDLDAHLSVP